MITVAPLKLSGITVSLPMELALSAIAPADLALALTLEAAGAADAVALHLTPRELADRTNLSERAAIRGLHRLEDAGWVQVEGGEPLGELPATYLIVLRWRLKTPMILSSRS